MKLLLQPILTSILAGIVILLIPKRFRKVTETFRLLTSLYLLAASVKIFFNSPVNVGYLYVDG
ncbi:MAG: hypothetical protein KKD90_05955, partial [Candidatus Omnitrophica bacterium]|nr:hypothetical protein [Candidatus Omnitrophota bacterium]